MEAHYRSHNVRLVVKVAGENQKEIFRALAAAQDVFEPNRNAAAATRAPFAFRRGPTNPTSTSRWSAWSAAPNSSSGSAKTARPYSRNAWMSTASSCRTAAGRSGVRKGRGGMSKRKGTRNEHRSIRLLEAAGYHCTRAPPPLLAPGIL